MIFILKRPGMPLSGMPLSALSPMTDCRPRSNPTGHEPMAFTAKPYFRAIGLATWWATTSLSSRTAASPPSASSTSTVSLSLASLFPLFSHLPPVPPYSIPSFSYPQCLCVATRLSYRRSRPPGVSSASRKRRACGPNGSKKGNCCAATHHASVAQGQKRDMRWGSPYSAD